jgi:hypothetical protein
MAIAITAAPGLWTGTTPLTPAKTINAGETVIVTVVMTPNTCAVSGITGGGAYTLKSSVTQGACKVEQWVTSAPGGATAASSLSIAISGAPTRAGCIVETATGVVAYGNTNTNQGTTANPSIDVNTQDANNYVVAGYGWIEAPTLATTGLTGTLSGTDDDGVGLSDAGSNNTRATSGLLTNAVTHGTSSSPNWGVCAIELRSTAGGGGGVTPRPGCLTMIADRMAKAIMMASAVHTVIGRHELRGAAQRTKVALPIVKTVRITPPKAMQEVLPYPWKGPAVKKPRPALEVFLIRKPLPFTKSVQLAHMLRGAPQRKPALAPELATTRTPFPLTRPFVGKHVFIPPAAPVRIIVDPTTTSARTTLPRTRSWVARFVARTRAIIDPTATAVRTPLPIVRTIVARAVIQHPTTGSAAPIVSMIEMDLPVARSFVAHRTTLLPPPPAPSRARPIVVSCRIRPGKVTSFDGTQRNRLLTSSKRWAQPTVVLRTTSIPRTRSWIGIPRLGPIVSVARARGTRPIAILVRSPIPVIRTILRPAVVGPRRTIRAYLVVDSSGPQFMISDSSTSEFVMISDSSASEFLMTDT